MERHLDEELRKLKEKLIHMGKLAQEMIAFSIQGLTERKFTLTEDVYKKEEILNNMQLEIDEITFELLATRQPVARDLRFLVMVSKINGELERIGDQAVNISQNTQFLLQHPPLKPLVDLPIMANLTENMIKESLAAFINGDSQQAQKVLFDDDQVDAFKDGLFRELLTFMTGDATTIPRALALLLISRNLERIGDHATNIAEEVIYLVEGKDVRHHHEEKKRRLNTV